MSVESRTIVVGDVHGCYAELRELLLVLELRRTDHLVFVGDLVDKGPASALVVEHLRQLREEAALRVTLVLGNHEEKFARWRKHEAATSAFGLPNPMRSAGERFVSLIEALAVRDVAFLDSAVLYAPVPGGIVVHAGIPPALLALPPEGAKFADFSGREKRLFGQMLRVRYVRGDVIVPLGEEQSGDLFWADVYDSRFGHVWFGHAAAMEVEPRQFPHATGLDLGCVYGGRLAAAVLAGGDVRYVSVPSGGTYASLRGVGESRDDDSGG